MQPKRTQRSAGTATPRGRVRGKLAYSTSAIPDLAPALVRRRPRRTSRRAKRPRPQPCPSTASSGMLGRDGAARRASKCVASMARWWGRGPFENTRGCRGGTATTDRSIRTHALDGGVAETAQFAGTTKGPSKGQGKVAVERLGNMGAPHGWVNLMRTPSSSSRRRRRSPP